MDRKVAFGDTERFAFDVGERVDASALAGNDGIGRFVEQHEHRLDRGRTRFVAKADQRVDVGQREIAGAGADARNRVLGSAGNVGRDRETLGAKQAAGRGHHERSRGGIDRTIEGKLDGDRLPNVVRGPALSQREIRKTKQAYQ